MAISQSDLARKFAQGANSGSASNMSIVPNGSGTHLVGYGWAIYATRHDDGTITVYEDGWSEWAREKGGQATQSQFAQIRHGLKGPFNRRPDEHPSSHAMVSYPDGENPKLGPAPDSVSRVGSTPTR